MGLPNTSWFFQVVVMVGQNSEEVTLGAIIHFCNMFAFVFRLSESGKSVIVEGVKREESIIDPRSTSEISSTLVGALA